jgi:antitoxin (DNA-binding transcriptional repressor) of toxin-antitoxin stability system
MEYVTTTGLRTKSSQLVSSLKKGDSVTLVHRSQIIGTITPQQSEAPKVNEKKLEAFLKSVKPKKLIPKNKRESVYRANLEKKYGKNISRH